MQLSLIYYVIFLLPNRALSLVCRCAPLYLYPMTHYLIIPVVIAIYFAFKWATSQDLEYYPTEAEELDRLLAVEPEDWYRY